MKIDRVLQRTLLEQLAAGYPQRDDTFTRGKEEKEWDRIIANLLYLEEHGLIDAGLRQAMDGEYAFMGAKITARGIDFLADDGGLSVKRGSRHSHGEI